MKKMLYFFSIIATVLTLVSCGDKDLPSIKSRALWNWV